MALETGTHISDLVATNPTSGDPVSQADDHMRLIKSAVKATFPNVAGAVTPTHTELNYVDGVTSAIQSQIDTKPRKGPAVCAVANATQSVTSGVATKVTLATELFDTDSLFSSSRFTPNVSGYYQVNGLLRAVATNGTIFFASIYKNGAEYTRGNQLAFTSGNGNFQQLSVSDVIFMNGSTDYIELFGSVTGTSPSFDFTSSAAASRLSAVCVRD